jgi:prepilin-type N-terminal cleavage/methylation domain-containing protein
LVWYNKLMLRLTRSAFTLIELLIVIAIIAILSVVVILTLNPAQIIMQSRDSNRISDMSTLNSALGIYLSQGGLSLGTANTVYVSIPDPTATTTAGDQCQGLGLISLPGAYSYHCAASSTYRNVDGTGWIPVNFSSIATGAPFSQLPTDPLNTSSSRTYYTYNTNGSNYEVTSIMESSKYKLGGSNDVIGGDGGTLATVYEKGSKLGLEPLDYGDTSLVGYWSFEEGSSSVAYDYSGNNATGSWAGTQSGTNGYYSVGKVGPWAGYFDGTDNTISQAFSVNALSSGFTMSAWINPTALPANTSFIGTGSSNFDIRFNNTSQASIFIGGSTNGVNSFQNFSFVPSLSAWTLYTITFNGSLITVYQNGLALTSQVESAPNIGGGSPTSTIIGKTGFESHYFSGLIDDVRIYNRALSAAEIAAMYAGGK